MREQADEKDAPVQTVEKIGDWWVGTCDHGPTVWVIHRGTEHLSRRSLRAHLADCPRVIPSDPS